MHLTQLERFKENTLTSAVLTIQEATFNVQLDHDRRVHLTWLQESVFPHRQSDTASYRAKTFISLTALSWILRRLRLRFSLIIQEKKDGGLCEWKVLLLLYPCP